MTATLLCTMRLQKDTVGLLPLQFPPFRLLCLGIYYGIAGDTAVALLGAGAEIDKKRYGRLSGIGPGARHGCKVATDPVLASQAH